MVISVNYFSKSALWGYIRNGIYLSTVILSLVHGGIFQKFIMSDRVTDKSRSRCKNTSEFFRSDVKEIFRYLNQCQSPL